jgi:two-component system chemotaxis response regulator CheB
MPQVVKEWLAGLPQRPPAAEDQSTHLEVEVRMAELDPETMHDPDRPGDPAGFGCPDCAGALYQIDEGGLRRYRCRVGHAWSPESLLAQQTIAMESALWMALRTLEEKAALNLDMAQRAREGGHRLTSDAFEDTARETHAAAEMVRQLIEDIGSTGRLHEDLGSTGTE